MQKLLSSVLLLTGTLGLSTVPVGAAEGIIYKVSVSIGSGSNYCHLKFPAIREETLNWDRPVLKDSSDGDIIDFFGPCDYDPLGQEEIFLQRLHYNRCGPGREKGEAND